MPTSSKYLRAGYIKSTEFAPSTIFTKCSILNIAAALDPPLSEQLENLKFLERDFSVSIYHQNISFSTIEMFKMFKDISPQIGENIFQFRDALSCQLRKQTNFLIAYVHSLFSCTDSIKFLKPKVWKSLPHEIKQLKNFEEIKKSIKQWKPTSCLCCLSKTYIPTLCFIRYRIQYIRFYYYLSGSSCLFDFY